MVLEVTGKVLLCMSKLSYKEIIGLALTNLRLIEWPSAQVACLDLRSADSLAAIRPAFVAVRSLKCIEMK